MSQHHPLHHVFHQVGKLTHADVCRFAAMVRTKRPDMPEKAAEDLIQEAIERILKGARPWPVGISFNAFLAQVLRSRLSKDWEVRVRKEAIFVQDDPPVDTEAEPASARAASDAPDQERKLAASEIVTTLRKRVAHMRIESGVLDRLAKQYRISEIMDQMAISRTRADRACRLLRTEAAKIVGCWGERE